MSKFPRETLPILGATAVILLVASMVFWWFQKDRIDAKTTVTRMREVMILLQSHTGPCDLNCIRSLADANGKSTIPKDAWGSSLEIELVAEEPKPSYRIRSLGKDGKVGPCCEKWVDSLEEDAVLQDDTWLQVWRY